MTGRIGLLLLILILNATVGIAADLDALRNTVARIETPGGGGCSAVCVSAEGHLLTVAHCRPNRRTSVRVKGKRYRVQVLYRPPVERFRRRDFPTLLQIDGNGPFVFARLAKNTPQPGDEVIAMGYPAGRFARQTGRVRGTVTHNGQRLIQTDFRVFEGHSGGPLFSREGELVGLASTRSPLPGEAGYRGDPPASNWVHTDDLRNVMRYAASAKPRRTLYIFSQKSCAACRYVRRFERELRTRWQPHGDVRILEVGTREFTEVAARCKMATGREVTSAPTFWIEGTSIIEEDYRRFRDTNAGFNVLAVVRWGVQAIAKFLIGRIRERRARPKSQPIPEREEVSPDWSAVTIVVLVPKRERGRIAGAAARLGLHLAAGPLRRRIDRALGERVGLKIVAERTHPNRYTAVRQAARLEGEAVALLVLIAKRPVGMFQSLERRIVERLLVGKLSETPVDLIFERTHPGTFTAIRSALRATESAKIAKPDADESLASELARLRDDVSGQNDERERWSLANTILGGGGILTGLIALWRRRRERRESSAG